MQDRIKELKQEISKHKEFRQLLLQPESKEYLLEKVNEYLTELYDKIIELQEQQINNICI